jgi:hypothetical protein
MSINYYYFLQNRVLLLNGANRDAQNAREETPLFLAAREGAYQCARQLLECHANRDITDHMDRLPRDVALERMHTDIVALLDEFVAPPPPPVNTPSSGQTLTNGQSMTGHSNPISPPTRQQQQASLQRRKGGARMAGGGGVSTGVVPPIPPPRDKLLTQTQTRVANNTTTHPFVADIASPPSRPPPVSYFYRIRLL